MSAAELEATLNEYIRSVHIPETPIVRSPQEWERIRALQKGRQGFQQDPINIFPPGKRHEDTQAAPVAVTEYEKQFADQIVAAFRKIQNQQADIIQPNPLADFNAARNTVNVVDALLTGKAPSPYQINQLVNYYEKNSKRKKAIKKRRNLANLKSKLSKLKKNKK